MSMQMYVHYASLEANSQLKSRSDFNVDADSKPIIESSTYKV